MKNKIKAAVAGAALVASPVQANTLLTEETLNQVSQASNIAVRECLAVGNQPKDCHDEARRLGFDIGMSAITPCKAESESFEQLHTCVNTRVIEILIEKFPDIMKKMGGAMGESI